MLFESCFYPPLAAMLRTGPSFCGVLTARTLQVAGHSAGAGHTDPFADDDSDEATTTTTVCCVVITFTRNGNVAADCCSPLSGGDSVTLLVVSSLLYRLRRSVERSRVHCSFLLGRRGCPVAVSCFSGALATRRLSGPRISNYHRPVYPLPNLIDTARRHPFPQDPWPTTTIP
uniref:Secreted protein n=1 Tax=Panagrellus redivivus TaxID=6233 RepID=A0A7E4VRW1_PANRE